MSITNNEEFGDPLDKPHHDHPDRHQFGQTFLLPDDPSESIPGDTSDPGVSETPARSDHRHGREGDQTPVGLIAPYAGSIAPLGYLLCDGAAVSRTIYADLFGIIGVTYGAGDGVTTFNLPNLKGKVIVGYNALEVEFDNLGETGGEKTHALTTAELAVHSHANTASASTTGSTSDPGSHGHSVSASSDNPGNHTHSVSTNSTGSTHNHTTTVGESGVTVAPSGGGQTASTVVGGTNRVTTSGSAQQLQFSNFTSHNHSVSVTVNSTNSGHTHGVSETSTGGHTHTITVTQSNAGAHTHTLTMTTTVTMTNANAGSGTAHNNLQPYITLNYIIKV